MAAIADTAAPAESAVAYFEGEATAPEWLEKAAGQVEAFVAASDEVLTVVVTSGGTMVPLERRTVRFVDNFSTGTRGSRSAEAFLAAGYRVVFLHRAGSKRPYLSQMSMEALFDADGPGALVETGDGSLLVPNESPVVACVRARRAAKASGMLLEIPFVTVEDYLWLLRRVAQCVESLGARAMMYLAAAVSDYYVPTAAMPEHKIQSSAEALVLELEPVPKMLGALHAEWAPAALVVSFKLETDAALVEAKARRAIAKYGVNLVVANRLDNRNELVHVVHADASRPVVDVSPGAPGEPIEIQLVQTLKAEHEAFVRNS
ncbi:phosphopantothenate-cysteine ligase [Thecamonas trahens ATCC 50062]|uniref:Phosphopantothenate-cysteine ligase n=1 Tax=Thecamonas trahens ATCC 50062 TaxID=461836 RepID=A0A0L0D7N6_THETB|nr:phosphopantothenate-cysteine ligase [Thecamonas trahens ATCC 50062]KNC47318.1 phosphopantothenate-cysteine ligase [Thecamonas trahens ATCC 50062]|eukprot:XP_013759656.1 phosphopantothenate-cysteine ligase [Thecamonas trahens ATCC 50062]